MSDLDAAAASAQESFSSGEPVVTTCSHKDASAPDPASQVVTQVKNRSRKSARACRKAAQKKYGVRPRNLFGYLDGPKHIALAKAITEHSSENISPELLYTVMMLEGLNHYFDDNGKKAREGTARVSGFDHAGLDDFGSDAGKLKSDGYLREDFDKGDEYTVTKRVNEHNEVKKTANFSDLDSATEAASAELSWRRDVFLQDADSILGEDQASELTPEEIDYWTYIYFNSGIGSGRKRLKKRKSAKIKKWKGDPEGEGQGYSDNAHSNALVRLATLEYLRCTGVLKTTKPDDCTPESPAPVTPGVTGPVSDGSLTKP